MRSRSFAFTSTTLACLFAPDVNTQDFACIVTIETKAGYRSIESIQQLQTSLGQRGESLMFVVMLASQ